MALKEIIQQVCVVAASLRNQAKEYPPEEAAAARLALQRVRHGILEFGLVSHDNGLKGRYLLGKVEDHLLEHVEVKSALT